MDYEKVYEKKLYYVKDNVEYLFVPILNSKNDNELNIGKSYNIDELPNMIQGKYLSNYIGYNPTGWWTNITVNKNKLLCK